ncbi:hypothetical protein [Rummeliibacillus sp. SL167]|nr:hypothetical protein [Rummeliibacillus sp. SL167]
MKLTKDESESILVTLEVFDIYPRAVYEKCTDERLLEEYERIVGRRN